MRAHEEDSVRHGPDHPAAAKRSDAPGLLAQRALADGHPAALDAPAVAEIQRTAGNASVSRLLAQDDGEQRSPVLDVVGSGGGQALDPDVRREMEAGLRHDFGDVRVHTDSKASESAKAVHAQAYTVGNDVVFQSGNYAPGTDSGRRMLAHELAHVVQQRSGPVDGTPAGGGVSVSDPSDRFEQAADRAADGVMSGSRSSPADAATTGAPAVQREAADEAIGDPSVQRQEAPPEEEEPEEAPPE